jgi:hypothetical protein
MLIKHLPPSPTHPALFTEVPALRRRAAAALHIASRVLHRLASHLAAAPGRRPVAARAVTIEFHAEAGAPEGALYVDGQLVAHLAGVSRL